MLSPRVPVSAADVTAGSLRTCLVFTFGLIAALGCCRAAESELLVETPFSRPTGEHAGPLFVEQLPAATGIVTQNNYAPPRPGAANLHDPRVWADRYHEFEVGAVGTGVAIGDYDGDARPDLFVVSKTESCRLFRNLGGWKFEDVTERSGVADVGEAAAIWKQGATFADVNNDGRLDLYVARFAAPNLLYVNQGDGTFKEEAAARGLALIDASVMAAFCDYDRDGWIDVYVQTNLLNGTEHPGGQRDRLFHNRGDGFFTETTDAAGIRGETQGHSATWWDFDQDGWPDLYVANDFGPADNLYRNNRDGTFSDVIRDVVPHLPYSSMGADLGDVNNDGRIDFLVADMAATTHQKDQRGMATLREQVQSASELPNAVQQYARNALYLNTGTGRMLEVAQLAGLAATDWTWAVRLEDLDNDGRLDLLVTNGMHREVHNVDQLQRLIAAQTPAEKLRIEQSSPRLIESNLAYRNRGDLVFENVSSAWGLDEKGVSFGAALGDLDGDGDLDLVISNYQKPVTVLRNDSHTGHRVIFELRGTRSNRFGVGATVLIETNEGVQIRSLVLARGVLSSSEPVVHFGLGEQTEVRRATITWPSGTKQAFEHLGVDRKFTITEPHDVTSTLTTPTTPRRPLFTAVDQSPIRSLQAREAMIDELSQQPLLPFRQNRHGPWIAEGDLDGDRHDDLVIGGTTLDPARTVMSGAVTSLGDSAAQVNDGPVVIFDANGDGANDVLVTRGGSSLAAGSTEYQPQLWLNVGHGKFKPAPAGALPPLAVSVGAAAAIDFDQDGQTDVFIGAGILPGAYPAASRSALLRNRGGHFEDITADVAPTWLQPGLVRSAVWTDVDRDGWPDLVVAIVWGNVKCFRNDHGKRFVDVTESLGFSKAGTGWWTALAVADFNGDGRPDIVAGNLGLNTCYQADTRHPVVLFAGDFKGDSSEQLIEGYYEGDTLYPRRTRKILGAALPGLLKKFPKNDAYARASLAEILGPQKLELAERFAATELRSGVFVSQADGSYRFTALPRMAQVSPIQAMATRDFDGDGHTDIYAVQNSYAPVASVGRLDGGLSVLLRGDGHGGFSVVDSEESGLIVPGDAKGLAVLDLNGDGGMDIVVTRNNDTPLLFHRTKTAADPYMRNDPAPHADKP